MHEHERRAVVRSLYGERCGYCSVHETETGATLEIDHFQPRSVDGGDDLDNLVCCCTACNRLKGDFWPATDAHTTPRRLLHPIRDDLARHLHQEPDCRLTALTPTGAFHLHRLRLNRSPLVALRRTRQKMARLHHSLEIVQAEQRRLVEQIATLEQEVQVVVAQLARLLNP